MRVGSHYPTGYEATLRLRAAYAHSTAERRSYEGILRQ
jgi:hypothetical protein